MNIHDWAVVSDRAVMFAGIVYALAFVSHIVEWAISRTLAPSLVTAGGGEEDHSEVTSEADEERELQAEKYGRIGVAMTVIAAGLHLLGLVSR